MSEILDCVIIGGGPAGLSAGLYATRGGLKNVVMFEMGMPGGQITSSSEMENYPGVATVTDGISFMQPWLEQSMRFGLKHEMTNIASVRKEGDLFIVRSDDGSEWRARTAIVCTGSTPRRAGFAGEDEFFGRGVSTCATCDGFFYKNKPVVVLGGGDTALEEAAYLANICSKVYLVHRREGFRAAPSTVERARSNEKIEFVLNATVKEVRGDASGVTAVVIEQQGAERVLEVPGIFTFVGLNVRSDVLKTEDGGFICEMSPGGQVAVNLRMQTSVPGLFAAGDLRVDAPKQVVCAAADGATAALGAIAYIQENC